MGITTVTHAPQHASGANAKTESGSGQRRRGGWLHRKQPAPQPPTVEHSTFPRPDAPTQAIPAPRPYRPVAPAYRSPETDAGDLAINIAGIAVWAAKNNIPSAQFLRELDSNLTELTRRAETEQHAADVIARRNQAAAEQAARVARAIEDAVAAEDASKNVPGVAVYAEVDPQAMGKGLGALSVNAHRVHDKTMVGLTPITPDMPDPRVTVTAAEVETVPATAGTDPAGVPGVHAPIPDEAPATATPLPHREPQPEITVLPAAVDGDGEVRDPMDGVVPARTELHAGVWVLERADTSDPEWWLLRTQRPLIREQGVGALLEYANGGKHELAADEQVWVLNQARADLLLRDAIARHASKAAAA